MGFAAPTLMAQSALRPGTEPGTGTLSSLAFLDGFDRRNVR